jgi:carnosine N-methyltransferase
LIGRFLFHIALFPNRKSFDKEMELEQDKPTNEASSPSHKHNTQYDDDNENSSVFDDVDETAHFESVCAAYRQYANFAMCQWSSHEHRLRALPESQQKLLPAGLRPGTAAHSKRQKDYKDAVIRNQFCLDCILRHAGQPHSQQQSRNVSVTDDQISKISSVLKSLTRDWSASGETERAAAYGPIKAFVEKYLPIETNTAVGQQLPKIVVPGSGVGRLAFELAAMGYSVQGNEFSMYMLLASDFVLNNGGYICIPERPLHLSPWLLESRNVHKSTDPLRTTQIPDVDPVTVLMPSSDDSRMSLVPAPEFSMAAGDFTAIYNDEAAAEKWDCVASCFFLDACPNIVETLLVIYKMLRPGGIFVNLGPLLYHWSGPPMRPDDKSVQGYRKRYDHLDARYLTSINLYYDDIKEIMNKIGFEILEEEIGIECYYTSDQRSMMSTKYECVSFVARKRTH